MKKNHILAQIALFTICLTALASVLSGQLSMVAHAQTPNGYWFDVREIETEEVGIRHPAGGTYLSSAKRFLVFNGSGHSVGLSPSGNKVHEKTIALSAEWLNAAFDDKNQRLLVPDKNKVLWQISVNANGEPVGQPQRVTEFNLGSMSAQGIAFDASTQQLWALDGTTGKLARMTPNTAAATIDLAAFARPPLRGLALNPKTGNLYTYSPAENALYEFTQDARPVATRNFAAMGLPNPQTLFLAPSGDSTDDPANLNLYLVENGDNKRPGKIVEISLTPPSAPQVQSQTATLVNITNTGAWSPNAPDAAGVVYQPGINRLYVSDSEVEEMPNYWAGKNIFEATLGGSLTRTFTSFTSNPTGLAWNNYSNEPTGLGLNPANNHLFVSDDGKKKIFEVNPGNDGQLGTNDDTVTWFSTSAFGSTDPEDVAYGDGTLFIADGLNNEVYVVHPGNNGIFNGIPPTGDDTVTNFDVAQYGVRDTEGIGFDTMQNRVVVVDRRGPLLVLTTDGSLLESIDINFIDPTAPSDVAVAPSSNNPTQVSYYISDRMIDNGQDPNETDGRVTEITLGTQLTSTPTDTPTDTPTATDTPTNTPTDTPTNTATNTPTDTPTNTPTDTPTATDTPTDTPTNTPIDTPTNTPTDTPTDTPTNTPTDTPTGLPTDTPTNTPTDTPTDTPTGLPTDTPTNTPTDTPTATDTPTNTPTDTPTATAGPVNLLLNPSFELDNDNNNSPDNWTVNTHFTRSNQSAHSGVYSGKHFDTADASYDIDQTVNNITAGTSYVYSGWVNIPPASDTFNIKLQVRWQKANGSTISTSTIKTFKKATNGWAFAGSTLVAPAGTVKAQIRMRVTSLKVTIYSDDLFFGQQ